MTIEEFIAALAAKGIHLSAKQVEQFEDYYELLIEWNEKINLTAITERKEVYLKHFYDSLVPLWLNPLPTYQLSLCDVGAGAGFPSIPIKIVVPELELTIVDSLNKRIHFLETLVDKLGLSQVTCVHGRAEDIGQNPSYRAQFDIVTARAVAGLNVLVEYCLPLVKAQGYFWALKGQKVAEEVDSAKKAIATLGGKLEGLKEDVLPGEESSRALVIIKKTKETPNKYPRKAGKPAKQPII